MFGKRKAQIHDQAALLMHEWNMIMSSAGNCLEINDDFDDEEETILLALNLETSILGVMTYIVAGLNHANTATEMTEQYKRLFIRRKEQFNQTLVSEKEAVFMVNNVYQQARSIADQYMAQGKDLEDIILEFAKITVENCELEATDNNIGYFNNAYSIFHRETLEKYSGDVSSILGNKNEVLDEVEKESLAEDIADEEKSYNDNDSPCANSDDFLEEYISDNNQEECESIGVATLSQPLEESMFDNDIEHNSLEREEDSTVTIPVKELKLLKELYDDGIITDKEFSEKKRQLLGL